MGASILTPSLPEAPQTKKVMLSHSKLSILSDAPPASELERLKREDSVGASAVDTLGLYRTSEYET